jgi:hypothetical protein
MTIFYMLSRVLRAAEQRRRSQLPRVTIIIQTHHEAQPWHLQI